MSDNILNRGQPDRSKINMSEDSEVRYWAKQLGITKEKLASVVAKVGNSAGTVRKELAALEKS